MITNPQQRKIFIPFFIVPIAIFYFFILFGEKMGLDFKVTQLSFSVIVICFATSVAICGFHRDGIIVTLAMFFTVCADYFLVLYDDVPNGMFIFCFAQFFYFLRIILSTNSKKVRRGAIITVLCLFAINLSIGLIPLRDNFNNIISLTIIYFSFLFTNFVFSAVLAKQNVLFCIGLLFFLCCDVFIGLSVLLPMIHVSPQFWLYKIVFSSFNFVWFFYVPSQALITLSIWYQKKPKQQNDN